MCGAVCFVLFFALKLYPNLGFFVVASNVYAVSFSFVVCLHQVCESASYLFTSASFAPAAPVAGSYCSVCVRAFAWCRQGKGERGVCCVSRVVMCPFSQIGLLVVLVDGSFGFVRSLVLLQFCILHCISHFDPH